MAGTLAKMKIPFTSLVGVGTGGSVGTFFAELTSRATGQTGWAACGVKGVVKGVVGLVAFGVSSVISPGIKSMFLEMMSYGSWGSIFFDIFLAAYPGGLAGMAEYWAVQLRTMAMGGRRVAGRLGELEKAKPALEAAPEAAHW